MAVDYPKKKDWTKGKYQVGVFVRTPEGGTINLVADRPTAETVRLAVAIVTDKELAETIKIDPAHVFVHAKKRGS